MRKGSLGCLQNAAQSCFCAMKDCLAAARNDRDVEVLSLTTIDHTIAKTQKMKKEDHVTEIQKSFLEEDLLVVAFGDNTRRGAGSDKHEKVMVLTADECAFMFNFAEEQHRQGMTITNRKLRHEVLCEIEISRSMMQQHIKQMGLSWRPTRARKMTFKGHRTDAVGTFLIAHARALQDPEVGMVYIEKLCVHKNQSVTHSHLDSKSEHKKALGKGPRLIILRALTIDGLLCDVEPDGQPVNNLLWKGDTPCPVELPNGLSSAECLWMANSHTGDYHDNMNGEMFNKWLQEKCCPAFKKKCPGKKFVPVLDNTSHHHVGHMGPLNGTLKKKLIQLCHEHHVTCFGLPLTPVCAHALENNDECEHNCIQCRGDCARLTVDEDGLLWEEFAKKSSKSQPFAPSRAELQVGVVSLLKKNRPGLLECQMESFARGVGGAACAPPRVHPSRNHRNSPGLEARTALWTTTSMGEQRGRLRSCFVRAGLETSTCGLIPLIQRASLERGRCDGTSASH